MLGLEHVYGQFISNLSTLWPALQGLSTETAAVYSIELPI